ncbi:probable glycosyl transferase [Nonlabens ulvanivorans]|nr:glycosyltransferase family A protein [Nonlabens ulvanivorans]GAK93157.1 probable glycosyl transferase [Nonlabens ulvanivorans]
MNVSVIIPAYNVEAFIEKAINSVLQQSQVVEVLVINDGSNDGTREIIESITDSRVQLLHHSDAVNKGRSASRNLGLQNAQSDYIAFLDADDYYLPGRFDLDEQLFQSHQEISGVYNAVGFTYLNLETVSQHDLPEATTLSKVIEPEHLGVELVRGQYGHLHLNGLTVKRNVAMTFKFPEHLPVAEDTIWIWKLAFNHLLLSGKLKENAAMRCVHETNIFNNTAVYTQYEQAVFKEMLDWSLRERKELHVIEMFMERLFITTDKNNQGLGKLFKVWCSTFMKNSRLLFSNLTWKYFPIHYKRKSIKNKISGLWN